jgi:hypothetical protein
MADNQVDLKLNLDFKGVNDALYQMIGQFNGTDKEFQKIAKNIEKNAKELEAAIKLFGPASQQAGIAAKKIEKDLQSLVANGIDPASASFKKMTASMPTSAGLDATTGSLRRNNMQWSNLALVIQDLPFGFRGIQNNLPALAGGFAAMTGPIYLAISAIIAAITAWDMGLFKLGKTTKKVKEDQDDYTKSLNSSISSGYGEISQVKALVSVVNNQTISIEERRLALKKLQSEYPGYFKNMSLEKTSIDGLSISVGELTKAIIARAEATAMTSEIEKIATERYNNTKAIEKNDTAIVNMTNSLITLSKTEGKHMSQYGTITTTKSPYDVQLDKIKELEKANSKLRISNEALQNSMSLLQNSVDFRKGTSIGLDTKPPPKPSKPPKDDYAKDFLKALEEEQKLFKENLDNQLSYAEGNDTKKLQLLQKAMADLVAWYNQGIIEESFYQNTLADLYKQTYNLKQNLLKKELDKEIEIGKLIIQNRENIADAIDKINQNMTAAEIKKIQDALKVRLKLDRNNINLQIKDYKDALKKLQDEKAKLELLGLPIQVASVDKEIDEINNKIESLGDTFQGTAQGISNVISGFLADSFVSLAENIGNALSGGDVKPLEHFQKLLAEALINIGKMLIQYGTMMQIAFAAPDPFVAIAAGVAAVALGTIIKNRLKQSAVEPTAFANGGIVSGPTMGLMGEYPGAQNNPEVIAPLDKLKDLIGGGGSGQFVLRGQDLVLAMQRSNSSLNIRRG